MTPGRHACLVALFRCMDKRLEPCYYLLAGLLINNAIVHLNQHMFEKKPQQESVTDLRERLTHWPSGLETPDQQKMLGFAKELGKSVVEQVVPAAHEDGWYIQDENGEEKLLVASFDKYPREHRPTAYRVYDPNGSVRAYDSRPEYPHIAFKVDERPVSAGE